ncbi:34716_t:CDS:2, partial [Gigaspora margarita]
VVVDLFNLAKPTEFKKGLVEHFGAFTGNNNELYTTAIIASNYCSEHQKSVQELI